MKIEIINSKFLNCKFFKLKDFNLKIYKQKFNNLNIWKFKNLEIKCAIISKIFISKIKQKNAWFKHFTVQK